MRGGALQTTDPTSAAQMAISVDALVAGREGRLS